MPQEINGLVVQLKQKWANDPKSKPTPRLGQDDESMAFAVCRASLKLEEEQEALMLEGGVGPALVAVAATSKPHLRQRGHEIKIVDRDGKKLVEVPIFGKGIYRHPNGTIVVTDKMMDQMIENHNRKVTDYAVSLDFRHGDKLGAVAFLDVDDGGWLEKKGGWLLGYGPLASEEDEALVNSRKWRYASAEFWRDYQSNLETKLSTEQLQEVTDEQLLKEVIMPKKLKFGDIEVQAEEADGKLVLEDGDLTKVTDAFSGLIEKAKAVDALTTEVNSLKQQLADLKKEEDKSNLEEDLPEAVKNRILALEEKVATAERQRDVEKVAVVIKTAEAYRDKSGKGHSPAFLELARKGLQFEQIGEGDGVVKLQEKDGNVDYPAYHRNFIKVLLETLEGTVPMEGHTQGSETRLETGAGELSQYTKEELEEAYKELDKF